MSRPQGYQHWCTPTEILDRVVQVFGVVDLDPFSNPFSLVQACEKWVDPEEKWTDPKGIARDGFEHRWHGDVFFNPPFRRANEAVAKAHRGWLAGEYESAIGILPCSMNSKHWWMIEAAPEHGYFRRRPSFLFEGLKSTNGKGDVAIVYWGRDCGAFLEAFFDIVRFPRLKEVES